MRSRTFLASLILIAICCAPTFARPIINFLGPLPEATQSQQFLLFSNYRVASKIYTPTGNGRTHHVRRIFVVMIGNGTPTRDKFCVSILGGGSPSTASTRAPGAEVFTIRGASSISDMGATGQGNMRMWLVAFTMPQGAVTLMANRVFWLAPYVRNDDFSWWGFAHSTHGYVEWWHNLFYPQAGAWKRYSDHFNQRFAYRIDTDQP